MASTIPVYCWGVICFVSRLWRLPDLEKFRSRYSLHRIGNATKYFKSCPRKYIESESLYFLDFGHRSNPFGRLAQNTHLWIGIHRRLLRDNDYQSGNDHSYIWDSATVRNKCKSRTVGNLCDRSLLFWTVSAVVGNSQLTLQNHPY